MATTVATASTAATTTTRAVKALRALYLSTGGPTSWLRNACWLNESVPVCWWDQVRHR
jgi:hypothetical protein